MRRSFESRPRTLSTVVRDVDRRLYPGEPVTVVLDGSRRVRGRVLSWLDESTVRVAIEGV